MGETEIGAKVVIETSFGIIEIMIAVIIAGAGEREGKGERVGVWFDWETRPRVSETRVIDH